ncbi:MAG: hypothetical protein ACRDJO_00350, partial [Actinomycetota bacterium]
MKTRTERLHAAITAGAPVALLGAMASHPHIPDLTDKAAVAAAAGAGATRWALSHLAVGIASALLLLALLAVCAWLGAAEGGRRSGRAVPLLVVGSTLFAFLPAIEIATLGAVEAGADPVAVQSAIERWFVPIMLASNLSFGLGIAVLARSLGSSGALPPRLAGVVVGALALTAVTRFVPSTPALALGGIAAVVALWPLALTMWRGGGPAAGPASGAPAHG